VNRVTRLWWGGGLAALGVVCWALVLVGFEPAVREGADTIDFLFRTRTSPALLPGGDEVAQMLLWPRDLRWAAMALALGGLLIATDARTAAVLAMPLWLALDLSVANAEIFGRQAFAVLAGGVGVILAAGVWAAQRLTRTRPVGQPGLGGNGILVYCGVAAALTPLMFNVDPSTSPFRPRAMMAVAVVLSLGLAVAAVLAALTAAARSSRDTIGGALVFASAVALPTIVVQWWFAEVRYPDSWLIAVPWVAAPILLLGCVLLAKGRPATVLGWIGTGLQAAVVSGLSFVLIWFGLVLSLLVYAEYLDRPGAGYQIVIGGLIAGPLTGVVAMIGGGRRRPRTA